MAAWFALAILFAALAVVLVVALGCALGASVPGVLQAHMAR